MAVPIWIRWIAKRAAEEATAVYRNRRVRAEDADAAQRALADLGTRRVSNVQTPHHYGRKLVNARTSSDASSE